MADRYWRGGAGTWDTTTTTNWSTSSGGAGGASVPTAADSVFFDQAGTYTVTCTGALTCLDITVSAGTVTFADGTTPTFAISGSMSLVSGTVWSASGDITFNATSTGKTITTNGTSLGVSASIIFNGVGGGWTLGSAFTSTINVNFTAGSFDTNSFACSSAYWTTSGSTTRSISLGNSTITLSSSGVGWSFGTTTGLTFSAGTSTINFTGTGPQFTGGGLTYSTVGFIATGATNPSIIDGNTFYNLNFSAPTLGVKSLTIGGNQTVTGALTANDGAYTARTFFLSDVSGTARTITAATVALAYCDFLDITGAGAGSWTGTSFGDCGGNSGITFNAAKTVYWNLAGAQQWSATGWATSSGGSPAAANFPLAQDTVVFDNTGSVTGTITTGQAWNIGTLNMSARTSAMTLFASSGINIYGSWLNGTGLTFTSTTSVITFSGRTTQQLTSNGVAFTQPITIDTGNGTVQLQDALTTGTTRTVTLTSGTLNLNGKTLTTGLFSANNSNTRTLAFGVGNIICAGTGSLWTTQTVTGLTVTGTPVVNVTSAGATSIFVGPGVLSETNSISFNFTGGTYSLNFLGGSGYSAKNVNFTGYAGTWGVTSTATIYGNLTLSTGMTLTAGLSAMTFGATSGTQTLTSNTKTMDFPITKSGAGTLIGADALTLGSTRALTFALGTIQLKAGATSTVGSFVTSGTTPKYLLSTTAGTQATISDAGSTNSPTYLYIKDSAATGGATWSAAGTNVVNGGNNTGWTSLPTQAPFLIGVSAAGSAGTVTTSQTVSNALTGVSAAGSVGKIVPALGTVKILSGVAASGGVGTVTTSQAVSKALTGVSATGRVGAFAPLSGVAATGGVGTVTVTQTVAITGVSAAGGVGKIVPALGTVKILSGVQASGAVGTITLTQFVALTGVQAAGSVGTLGLIGVSATGSVGTVTTSQAFLAALTGVEAAGSVDTVTTSQASSQALTGVEATGNVGTVVTSQSVSKTLTGVSAQGAVGTVTSVYYPTGVSASGAVGVITAAQGTVITPSSVSAFGSVGTIIASQSYVKVLTGVSASGILGTVVPIGWSAIDNSQNANWGVINNAQTGAWTLVDNSQTNTWQLINTVG